MANNKKKNNYPQKKKSNAGILITIVAIIIAIFAALWFLNNSSNKEKTATSTLYGDYKIKNQSTINQLDDENYQNIILPDDLEKKIKSGDGVFTYFFSPECSHCQVVTPKLMPLAENADVDINQYNILEFTQGWDEYSIEATPTLVYYKDGKEIGRIVGEQPDENFEKFFEDMKNR